MSSLGIFQVAILKGASNKQTEADCHLRPTRKYVPIYVHLNWIRKYVGNNMCDLQSDYVIAGGSNHSALTKRYVIIAGVYFLALYIVTLYTLIWLERTNTVVVKKESIDEVEEARKINEDDGSSTGSSSDEEKFDSHSSLTLGQTESRPSLNEIKSGGQLNLQEIEGQSNRRKIKSGGQSNQRRIKSGSQSNLQEIGGGGHSNQRKIKSGSQLNLQEIEGRGQSNQRKIKSGGQSKQRKIKRRRKSSQTSSRSQLNGQSSSRLSSKKNRIGKLSNEASLRRLKGAKNLNEKKGDEKGYRRDLDEGAEFETASEEPTDESIRCAGEISETLEI